MKNLAVIQRNTLAGITTSLAMVPEVVAFAILAHVNLNLQASLNQM
jgi:MFS superfamily sulfate permease-like transporter